MPPKNQPSKKTEQKQKEKIIEDKTFGLKNKKGAKQQKFIQQVQSQVKGNNVQKAKQDELERKKEKDKKLKEMEELNALFKMVEQTVPKGVDPKSILCEAFKKAKCTKGDKCKFSHDLNIHKKAVKMNAFEDKRDIDTSKDPRAANPNRTSIVCRHFLEAVESKKFGWFWKCPNNGDECQYVHALPEGYVLKSDQKKTPEEEAQDKLSLDDLIERERAMITDTTKITLKSFLEWKKRKVRERQEKMSASEKKKQSDFLEGKMQGISGREMFSFGGEGGGGGDGGEDDEGVVSYERENEDSDVGIKEINLEEFSAMIIRENEEELERQERADQSSSSHDHHAPHGVGSSSNGGGLSNGTSSEPGAVGGVEIDEDLFLAEDADDLDTEEDEEGEES